MSISTELDLKASFLRVKVVYNKSDVSSILVIKIQVYSNVKAPLFPSLGYGAFGKGKVFF